MALKYRIVQFDDAVHPTSSPFWAANFASVQDTGIVDNQSSFYGVGILDEDGAEHDNGILDQNADYQSSGILDSGGNAYSSGSLDADGNWTSESTAAAAQLSADVAAVTAQQPNFPSSTTILGVTGTGVSGDNDMIPQTIAPSTISISSSTVAASTTLLSITKANTSGQLALQLTNNTPTVPLPSLRLIESLDGTNYAPTGLLTSPAKTAGGQMLFTVNLQPKLPYAQIVADTNPGDPARSLTLQGVY